MAQDSHNQISPESVFKQMQARYRKQGPAYELLVTCLKACIKWPGTKPFKKEMLLLLKELPPDTRFMHSKLVAAFVQQLAIIFSENDNDLTPFVPWCISLLRRTPEWTSIFNAFSGETSHQKIPAKVPKLFSNDLFSLLLEHSCIIDVDLENILINLRGSLLRKRLQIPSDSDWEKALLMIARQCWNNEFVFYESTEETRVIEAISLPGSVDQIADEIAGYLLLYACYRPLWPTELTSDQVSTLKSRSRKWSELIKISYEEPRFEQETAISFPAITRIDQKDLCGSFYEETPYPRWLALDRTDIHNISETLASLFPHYDWKAHFRPAMEVLIAGCGTGQQLLYHSLTNPDARITGIDLSRASLSYTARMVSKFNLDENIELYQADLTNLADWNRNFDLIECGGVIHHLTEPETGLVNILKLLKPGGLMRLGIYSKTARKPILDIRKRLNITGKESPEKVRSIRHEILNNKDPFFDFIKMTHEFYSLNTFRDLLCHPRERQYNLPEITEWCRNYDLEILGLELWNPMNYSLYRKAFPNEPSMTNLGNWWKLESDHPDLFSQMYVLWLKKG